MSDHDHHDQNHRLRGFPRPTAVAHSWVADHLPADGVAIDATAGNGHDTLFLAQASGPGGKVHGFDVQTDALESTQRRLDDAGICNVTLHHCCHSTMGEKLGASLTGKVDAVMFNLGYLPGGDKSHTTRKDTTLQAIEVGLSLLTTGGIMTIVIYAGHASGVGEAAAVKDYVAQLLPSQWHTAHYRPLNQPSSPPELIGIVRRMP